MYVSAGQSWVVEGYVILCKGKKKEKWEVLLASVPSYFLSLYSKLKGYSFSRSVYAKLSELVPKQGREPSPCNLSHNTSDPKNP